MFSSKMKEGNRTGSPQHAPYNITANVYDAAVSEEKREAHRGVLRLTRTATPTGDGNGRMTSA